MFTVIHARLENATDSIRIVLFDQPSIHIEFGAWRSDDAPEDRRPCIFVLCASIGAANRNFDRKRVRDDQILVDATIRKSTLRSVAALLTQ